MYDAGLGGLVQTAQWLHEHAMAARLRTAEHRRASAYIGRNGLRNGRDGLRNGRNGLRNGRARNAMAILSSRIDVYLCIDV
jgi:hypothetical protein